MSNWRAASEFRRRRVCGAGNRGIRRGQDRGAHSALIWRARLNSNAKKPPDQGCYSHCGHAPEDNAYYGFDDRRAARAGRQHAKKRQSEQGHDRDGRSDLRSGR